MGKVYFLFFNSFLLVLTKSSVWLEDWALGYHSEKLDNFLILPNFQRSYVLSRLETREATRIYHLNKF